jgi:uncharacterized protein YjcR
MHGGARGSGAVLGNQNALKHGNYSKEMVEKMRAARQEIQEMRESMARLEGFLVLQIRRETRR